jgi:hypothetical protein
MRCERYAEEMETRVNIREEWACRVGGQGFYSHTVSKYSTLLATELIEAMRTGLKHLS